MQLADIILAVMQLAVIKLAVMQLTVIELAVMQLAVMQLAFIVCYLCKRSKPMSFVLIVQKQTFHEHPIPLNTAYCIYDKCMKNGSLAYT